MHWSNAWISFEAVPKQNALEIVRGSHRRTRYDGTTFRDLGANYFDRCQRENAAKRLTRRLAEFGYKVNIEPAAAA